MNFLEDLDAVLQQQEVITQRLDEQVVLQKKQILRQVQDQPSVASYYIPVRAGYKTAETQTEQNATEIPTADDSKGQLISKAIFSFTLENLSQLQANKTITESSCVYIRSLPWKIKLIPNDTGLGVFLYCIKQDSASNWSCQTKFELRIRSYIPNTESFSHGIIEYLFCAQKCNFGYKNLILWQELQDPQRGLIRNGAITVEVYVDADVEHPDAESEPQNPPMNNYRGLLISQVVFSFTAENIIQIMENRRTTYSPVIHIKMLPWKILLEPNDFSLGLYLRCNGETSTMWSCKAKFVIKLKRHIPNTNPLSYGMHEIEFRASTPVWGYKNFIFWPLLLDPTQGFIRNGAITVEVVCCC